MRLHSSVGTKSSQHRDQEKSTRWSILQEVEGRLGKSGATLEVLVAGAVVLASHHSGFDGVNFKNFFGRLLCELGVPLANKRVKFPREHTELKDFRIPFLSPPGVAWPDEFLAFWKNPCAQFGSMRQSLNGDRMEIQTHSGILSVHCRDWGKFMLSVLKYVLQGIPSSSKIHLIVVKRLEGEYFTRTSESETVNSPLEMVIELENESASAFLERIDLQHAKFYRTSKQTGGRLNEFTELMQARRDPSHRTSFSAGGADKTIIFIEIGDWTYRSHSPDFNRTTEIRSPTHVALIVMKNDNLFLPFSLVTQRRPALI